MPQKTIEHEIENETEAVTDTATLGEEEENKLELHKIRQATIKPGLMRLPVTTVTSAANSPQWAIDLDHPIEGELRIFCEAPLDGWNYDNELVQVLNWYGVDGEDPFQLQTRGSVLNGLYVKKTGDKSPYAHGWELAEPPDYDDPIKVQLNDKWENFKKKLNALNPSLGFKAFYISLILGGISPAIFFDLGTGTQAEVIAMILIGLMAGTLIGTMLSDIEEITNQ